MKKVPIMIFVFLLSVIFLCGCNFPGYGSQKQDSEIVLTSAAETVAVQLTQLAAQNTTSNTNPTSLSPTQTPPPIKTVILTSGAQNPTQIQVKTSTSIPTPCNRASFITDVTVPDNTNITADSSFTKTWRLKNTGTCTWTSGYRLIFDHGDKLGAADAVQFTTGSVNPGETVDISIDLTAPNEAGQYQGYFRLQSSDNIVFGIGNNAENTFFVKINTLVKTPTSTITQTTTPTSTVETYPDLTVTDITLNPDTPVKDEAVHINITIMNNGNAQSGSFVVKWWPGEYYTDPACSWNIDSLNASGGRVLECDYPGYPSSYSGINTKVFVDADNSIIESDEGNNVLLKSIDVTQP